MLFFVSKSDIGSVADDNTLSSRGKMLGDILHIKGKYKKTLC